MITIKRWYDRELKVESDFDHREELELTITDESRDSGGTSIWLTREEVKKLVDYLQSIL